MNIKLLSNYTRFLKSVIIIQRWWRKYNKKCNKIIDIDIDTINSDMEMSNEPTTEIIKDNASDSSNETNMDIKRYKLYRKRKYNDIYVNNSNNTFDNNNENNNENNDDNPNKKVTKKNGISRIFSSVLKFFKFK